MDWDDYRYFLVSARSSSLRAAAKKLKVSHSTVLRRLDRLEARLGTRLFERGAAGFQLTQSGEDVLLGAAEIEDSLQTVDRLVTGQDTALSGGVIISMPDILAHHTLFPDIKLLNRKFPGIQLKVDLTYSLANLNKREADIAIRFTNNPSEDLVGRAVGDLYSAPYATKKYIEQHKPKTKKSTAQWIGWGDPSKWLPRSVFPHLGILGVFDNMTLQIDLAKAGMGVGMLPCVIADKIPSLVCLAEPKKLGSAWVLYHADLRATTRIRIVRDFFVDALREKLANHAK
ncbi:LysR family transcriptional regulator [Gammaproteobacteria bacterium]|nr:LysR family transcriptional regulator [Gammaproteobacteria bacterium]